MAFGQNIQAGLMQTDASGIERAGQAYAGGMAAFGQGIGNALDATADFMKQQNERKKVIKQAELYGNAAKTLFPEIATSIDESLLMIKNEDIPLSERFAAAEAIQGTLNMGMQRMKYDSEEMNAMRQSELQRAKFLADMQAANRPDWTLETLNAPGGEQQIYRDKVTGRTLTPAEYNQMVGQSQGLGMAGGGNVPELPADQQALFDSTMPAPMDGDAALIAQSLAYDEANNIYTIEQGGERVPVDEAQAVQILQAAEMGQQGGISDAMVLPDKPQPLGFKPKEPKSTPFQGGEMLVDEMGREYQADINNPQVRKYSNGQIWEVTTSPDGSVKMTQRTGAGGKKPVDPLVEEQVKKQGAMEVNRDLSEAIKLTREVTQEGGVVGGLARMGAAKFLPNSKSDQLASKITVIKDRTALSEMRKLKALSPTGSTGLGSQTEKEGQRLENARGQLDVKMDPEKLQSVLRDIAFLEQDYIHGSDDTIHKMVEKGQITKQVAEATEALKRRNLEKIFSGDIGTVEEQATAPPPIVPSQQPMPQGQDYNSMSADDLIQLLQGQ